MPFITSGIGITRARLEELDRAGVDHVQLSLQGIRPDMADRMTVRDIVVAVKIVTARGNEQVHVARDAAEAIARLGDWQQPPDLVISDLHLQDGNTGPEVLQAIARHYGQAPDAPKFARLLVTGETRPDIIDAITEVAGTQA